MTADKAVSILLLLLLPLGGCGYRGPALAGYPGLQWETWSFYEDRALEENATCTQPKMNATSVTQVLENTPQRLVARVRYHYVDESADQTRSPGNFPGLGNPFRCEGWGLAGVHLRQAHRRRRRPDRHDRPAARPPRNLTPATLRPASSQPSRKACLNCRMRSVRKERMVRSPTISSTSTIMPGTIPIWPGAAPRWLRSTITVAA